MSHVAESETTLEAGAVGGGKKKVRKTGFFYFRPFFRIAVTLGGECTPGFSSIPVSLKTKMS